MYECFQIFPIVSLLFQMNCKSFYGARRIQPAQRIREIPAPDVSEESDISSDSADSGVSVNDAESETEEEIFEDSSGDDSIVNLPRANARNAAPGEIIYIHKVMRFRN